MQIFYVDYQRYEGRWGHPACKAIISNFLFRREGALGRQFAARFGPPLKAEILALGHATVYSLIPLSLSMAHCLSLFSRLECAWKNGGVGL